MFDGAAAALQWGSMRQRHRPAARGRRSALSGPATSPLLPPMQFPQGSSGAQEVTCGGTDDGAGSGALEQAPLMSGASQFPVAGAADAAAATHHASLGPPTTSHHHQCTTTFIAIVHPRGVRGVPTAALTHTLMAAALRKVIRNGYL
ncbi:hypothetical protein ACCO45_001301 [Purpureocillium lilacinum]|uniref:Uncharacterized protein n=1 Tax=Purpureocillium lilacinum TaxID=33203 RepID=A0ACC4E6P8_PURLI